MNAKNAILSIQRTVNNNGEKLVMVKEPVVADTDIDVLITNRHKSYLQRDIINNSGVPVFYDGLRRGFAYYLGDGKIGGIDLMDFPSLNQNSIKWLIADAVRSKYDSLLFVLSKEKQVIYSIYKSINKWKVKEHRLRFLLSASNNIDLEELKDELMKLFRIQNENPQVIQGASEMLGALICERLSFELYSEIIKSSRLKESNFTRFLISNRIKRFRMSIRRRRNVQTSMPVVAVVGVDGTGKSSVVSYLSSQAAVLRCAHFRLETKNQSHALNYLLRVIRWITRNLRRIIPVQLSAKLFALQQSLSAYLIFLEVGVRIRGFYRKAKSGFLVVVDRWWFDYFVASKRSSFISKRPWLLELYLEYKSPDLIIFMNAPFKVISKRRPDENIDELEKKRNGLRKLLDEHFSEIYIEVDGTSKIEDNIKIINEALYKQWGLK